jgi:hypothetical protein
MSSSSSARRRGRRHINGRAARLRPQGGKSLECLPLCRVWKCLALVALLDLIEARVHQVG